MPKALRSTIGLMLLISTVSLASCQTMLHVISNGNIQNTDLTKTG